MAKYYFGIDLGTTNSAISYIEESRKEPQVIRLADGKLTLPSCVMLKDDGDYVVGSVAYENRYKNNTVYSVKRFIGTDTKIDLISENGKHKSTLTPEEVSSKILRKLVDDAELTFGKGIVKDVVITVPAYFNNNQRRSTKVAGELAGLNVVKIINEPTSASLAYGVEKSEKSETVMVYDLGGGTFDVTILDVIKGIKEDDFSILGITGVKEGVSIIYSDGDTKLGGDDLDDILVDIFTERTKEQLGITIEDKDKEKYKLELEKVKKQGEGLVFVNDEASKGVRISKSDIAQATKIIYDRTKNIINRCLKNCGGNINFSKIVFVGGSTKNEHLKEMIQRDFPDTEIMDSYKPDESVALGASVQALANASGYMTISDVVPISIGLKTLDEGTEKMSILLRHGDNLPASKNMKFGVVYTDIGKVGLDIYQGDSRLLSENTFIGSLAYDVPKGLKVVEVKFQIDLNGVLICSVITPQGEEKIELTNIFSLEGSKPKAGDYVDTIEDKIERKKYLRWLNVMKRAEASPKDIEDFNKAFEKGKGATFIKKFKTKVDKNVNVTLDKIGE